MRYKFYKLAIGQMKNKKLIALFSIIIALVSYLAFNINKEIIPAIKVICESRAQAIALTITSEVIEEHMSEFKYDKLMELRYNENGKISTISANISEMNKLSAAIVKQIQERLLNTGDIIVEIPVGKLLGWNIFSGFGPKINIKIIPAGNVEADFKTEFTAEGINQTKHTVYIEISTAVSIIAPFTSEEIISNSTVTVAETVIVGDIPNTYLTMENVDDLANIMSND